MQNESEASFSGQGRWACPLGLDRFEDVFRYHLVDPTYGEISGS